MGGPHVGLPDYARGVPDLVLLRHGESTWNAQNLFTGWTDVDLTAKGEAEARQAGALLAAESATGSTCRWCTPRCSPGRCARPTWPSTSWAGAGCRCGATGA